MTIKIKAIIVVFLFVFVIDALTIDAHGQVHNNSKSTSGHVYYAGEYSTLDASAIGMWGADVKNNSISSAGSKAGFAIEFGKAWYQYFSIDAYSTRSILPTEFGKDRDKEISLSSITAFFGQNIRWLPSIRFARTELWGIAVADGLTPVFDKNRLMSPGEEFDVGMTFDSIYLTWKYREC